MPFPLGTFLTVGDDHFQGDEWMLVQRDVAYTLRHHAPRVRNSQRGQYGFLLVQNEIDSTGCSTDILEVWGSTRNVPGNHVEVVRLA